MPKSTGKKSKESEAKGSLYEKMESSKRSGIPKYSEPGVGQITLFGPSLRDIAAFLRQLSVLLDAGIPLLRSLRIMSVRSHHAKLKKVANDVADNVERGKTLSASMEEFPKIFPALVINVVKTGEVSGTLETSLRRLAELMEKKADLKQKVISASIYPVLVLCVALFVVILILTMAIPRFESIYTQQGVPLPTPTKIILAISHFIINAWFVYIPLIIVLIILYIVFRKTLTGRIIIDKLKLKVPVYGNINTKIAVARFSRTLGTLLTSGVPLLEGVSVSANTSDNFHVRKTLVNVYDILEKGGKMEDPLRESNVFPQFVIDMIAIGDEAGTLDNMLFRIADTYDSDVDSTLRGLTSIMEPLLIVVLGCVVAFIALSVLLPYFNMVKVV